MFFDKYYVDLFYRVFYLPGKGSSRNDSMPSSIRRAPKRDVCRLSFPQRKTRILDRERPSRHVLYSRKKRRILRMEKNTGILKKNFNTHTTKQTHRSKKIKPVWFYFLSYFYYRIFMSWLLPWFFYLIWFQGILALEIRIRHLLCRKQRALE